MLFGFNKYKILEKFIQIEKSILSSYLLLDKKFVISIFISFGDI